MNLDNVKASAKTTVTVPQDYHLFVFQVKAYALSSKYIAKHIHRGIIKVPTVSILCYTHLQVAWQTEGRDTAPPNCHALLGATNARGVGREQRGNLRGGCMSKLCVE